MDLRSREVTLRLLVEALTAANVGYLRLHPETPWLYESGVAYEEDAEDHECWTDIPETRARGVGDCKDLVAWRLAELRLRHGESALPIVSFVRSGVRVRAHVVVRRSTGAFEDPSRILMRA